MINRRDLATGAAITAAAAVFGSGARAQIPSGAASGAASIVPPVGPWTKFGDLRRAGGTLHYATLGEDRSGRPPIVLLHKLGGWLSDWRFVAPVLAQGRRVIAFDLPGHGGSQWLGTAPYIHTLGESAALLIGALDEMGIDRVDLLGTSLGGCVAVPLAAFWPERVAKLAIISSALGVRRSLAEIATNIDARQTALFDAGGNPVPTAPAMIEQIFGIVHAEAINVEGIASRKAAGHWIQPTERGVAITDIAGTLKRVEAPTLLVYGDRDKAYRKFQPAAEAALKHVRTAVVPNSGAFVIQDNPAAAGAVLKAFVEAR
ncbi:alpha/beta fold hydrolase [Sphingomonas sp. 4RDLI-65]|uniref:alpha/beta fold hydrolase n=1 Tax=Sphingomonas sp. 4RDLI-65 TaxID=3111641 RepID=UPI003C1D0A3C